MRKLLLLFAGCLFSVFCFAQSRNGGAHYLSLGPVVGFGHSWVSGVENQKFKPSVQAGIRLIHSRHEHWGWGADLVVSHEGFKAKDELSGLEWKANPVYLRLTPKLYYFFGKYGQKIRPKLFVGPSVAYKIDERISIDDEKLSKDEVKMLFGDEMFHDGDLGITAGAGLNFLLSRNTWLNLDFAYTQGLLDVTDDGNANRNFRLNVGVLFGL